jgi:hypothetical protein
LCMDVLLLKSMITESSPKMDVLLCFSLLQKTRQVTKILVLFFFLLDIHAVYLPV